VIRCRLKSVWRDKRDRATPIHYSQDPERHGVVTLARGLEAFIKRGNEVLQGMSLKYHGHGARGVGLKENLGNKTQQLTNSLSEA